MKRKTDISVQDNRGVRVRSNMIVGDEYNGYTSGDILDGNATADLLDKRIAEVIGGTPVQTETDPTVPSWAKEDTKPTYTATEVGALAAEDAATKEQGDKADLIEEITPQAFAEVYADIEGLKENLENLGETKAICIDFAEMPKVCGQALVVIGSGAPSVVPMFIGQRYHDLANKKVYEAMSVSNSTSDWVLLN